MESIGQILKDTREQKGLSLDQVARDTHIAKRFILAIEEENFDDFPGDTYILGFLRNYAEYLGLDAAEIITRYKNLKIQEQPIPIEELLVRRTPKLLIAGILAAVLLLLGLGTFFLFRHWLPSSEDRVEVAPSSRRYEDQVIEEAFIQGDELLVERDGTRYTIRVEKISSTVVLAGPVERLSLREGQEAFIELTPGGETLKVFLRRLQRKEKPAKAVLEFDKIIHPPSADISGAVVPAIPADMEGAALVSIADLGDTEKSQLILESPTKRPFMLEVDFRGYCLFRHVTDNQSREERYFRRGETFRTDVRNEIRLWYSNGGSLRARVSGKEIEFGKPGEVGASLLTWVQAEPGGSYRLELIPMY